MSLKDDLSNLSATIKSIALIVFGALVAAIGRFGGGIAITVSGIGLIALGLILLAVAQVVQYLDTRRSSRFSKGLQRDVSDKFRQGWQRLAKAGKDKDPYFLPWYIMVGEPGAGKTQAIKHSNIKFVPGFNDPATGEGGTLAMDWWFADKAILLDTAGALLMDTARTEDFQEFLHRIRQHRPLLPINGLILAIPANALQTDTKVEIQSKATTIAQQLDLVQRELGVRFPVYVIITKADLISGFREYFDNINDPTMPTQILGWSKNPAGLDGAFDPAEVEKHLESVAASLRRRRLALLLDPSGDEQATKRIDKTDALFAFPEQLAQTGMRLRTYLEHVFMPSEWTQAPLFLRGIYFTSSMREGPPLDLDLAQSFNISPRDLPAEVRVWEREKSCFLRDLFVEKIFREKGLVTASKQVEKRVRVRKSMVLGVGLTALLAVIAFTIFGYLQLQDSVGGEFDFWSAATRFNSPHPVAASALDWAGQSPDTPLHSLGITYKDASTLTDLYSANVALAQKPIHTPWIFYFAEAFGGDINAQHIAAHRALFDRGVSRAAWGWLLHQRPWGDTQAWPWDDSSASQSDSKTWNDADKAGGNVLGQLILMDLGGASRAASDDAEEKRYAQLLKAAGWPDDASSARLYRTSWLWFSPPGSAPNPDAAKWAKSIVDRMIGYYDTAQQNAIKQRAELLSAVHDYDTKEQQFIALAKKAQDPVNVFQAWTGSDLTALLDAGNRVTASLQALSVQPGDSAGGETFAQLYDSGGATAGIESMTHLIESIQPSPGASSLVTNLTAARDSLRQRLTEASAGPKTEIAQLPDWANNSIDDWHNWPFAKRLAMYTQTSQAWAAARSPVKPEALADELNTAAQWLTAVNLGAADRDGIGAVTSKAMELAAHQRAESAWNAALTADQKLLTDAINGTGKPIALPIPPFARLDHPPSEAYAADKAAKILAQIQDRRKLWAASPIAPSNAPDLQKMLDQNIALADSQFLAGATSAWVNALSLRVSVPPELKQTDLVGITDQLKELGDTVKAALTALPAGPQTAAPLSSIAAGQTAAADLGDRGNRMLGDWIFIYAGQPPEEPHWHDELTFLQSQPANYVSDYWKKVAHCLAVYTDLMDKKPAIEVSPAEATYPNLPPAAIDDLSKLKAAYNTIQIGDGSPALISSNPRQTIKLNDGLDVRLQDSNNTQTPQDTAGGASQWEVIKLLSDFRSFHSSADPSVWLVYMETAKGIPVWLKLKFASDAPSF